MSAAIKMTGATTVARAQKNSASCASGALKACTIVPEGNVVSDPLGVGPSTRSQVSNTRTAQTVRCHNRLVTAARIPRGRGVGGHAPDQLEHRGDGIPRVAERRLLNHFGRHERVFDRYLVLDLHHSRHSDGTDPVVGLAQYETPTRFQRVRADLDAQRQGDAPRHAVE